MPQELNEIDWKGCLSNKTDRLAQHLCAYANLHGEGVLVFDVNDDATFEELSTDKEMYSVYENIIALNL